MMLNYMKSELYRIVHGRELYLFTGVLIERIKAQTERLKQQYPHIAFALGTHFGFEHEIFDLLDARAAENEQTASGMLECDGCKYRLIAIEAGHGGHHHEGHAHDHHAHIDPAQEHMHAKDHHTHA